MNREFEDGETVVYCNPGHKWHLMNFKAYKSIYTKDSYRLRYGEREVIADISEIRSMEEHNKLLQEEAHNRSYFHNDDENMYHTVYGDDLDYLGERYGIKRQIIDHGIDGIFPETDSDYRKRILEHIKPMGTPQIPDDRL